jgi:hypothetical protein
MVTRTVVIGNACWNPDRPQTLPHDPVGSRRTTADEPLLVQRAGPGVALAAPRRAREGPHGLCRGGSRQLLLDDASHHRKQKPVILTIPLLILTDEPTSFAASQPGRDH